MIQESRKIAHNHVLLKLIGYFTESAVIDTENIWMDWVWVGFFFFPILPDAGWKLQSEMTFLKPSTLIKETL